jgi:thiamine-phosphate pyrophosphorylase
MNNTIDFSLYLITDRRQVKGGDLVSAVGKALSAGVRTVQLREKDLFSRELYELAHDLRKVTAEHGARLLINDRVDIAQAVDADGVHLGGDSMPLYKARKILGSNKLIGVSCHNQVSAITAQEKGADFITFGPVFHTPSKASFGDPVGLEKLGEVASLLRIPVFGLGGINSANIPEVLSAGVHGIAMISAILAADDPSAAAAGILSAISTCRQACTDRGADHS